MMPEKFCRECDLDPSEAVEDPAPVRPLAERSVRTFQQITHDLGDGIDFSNIGEAIEKLDGPLAR